MKKPKGLVPRIKRLIGPKTQMVWVHKSDEQVHGTAGVSITKPLLLHFERRGVKTVTLFVCDHYEYTARTKTFPLSTLLKELA